MSKCECESCENEATHIHFMESHICEECVIRKIEEEGAHPEDFESL